MGDAIDVFADVGSDMDVAIQQVEEDRLIEVYSELEMKIAQLKPRMQVAYDYLSDYSCHPSQPVTDVQCWNGILSAVHDSLKDVKVKESLKSKVETMNENLDSLRRYISSCSFSLPSSTRSSSPVTEFWVYLGGVATCAARLSYLIWVYEDGKNPIRYRELKNLVSDLERKIMPCNSETIKVHFRLFKVLSIDPNQVRSTVTRFIKLWITLEDQLENTRLGLIFLIRFLVCAPDEFSDELQLIRLDIETVLAKAVSVNSLARRRRRGETALVELYELRGKIEILKAEAVLMGLMDRLLQVQTNSEELRRGAEMLQPGHPPMEVTDLGKLMSTHIEAMSIESASLYDTFHANPVNDENAIRDGYKLLVNIKLLKAQVFWLELISLEDNIQAIIEGLESLRKIISSNSNGNSDSSNVLGHVDEVACKAMSVYHSLHAMEGAENLVEEIANRTAELVDMINLAKDKAENVYVRVRSSSCINFPKTNGLGFLDFCLESLRKILNSRTSSGSSVKHLIERVLVDLESMRSFLYDTAEQCKVHQELENLHTRIIRMAYEADYAIDSIVLRNGAVGCHTICLSDIIEEIKLIKAEVAEIVEKKTYAIKTMPVGHTRRRDTTSEKKTYPISLVDQEEIIKIQLLRGSSKRVAVSIVGMGGIGKTTLAKEVFNDAEVKHHFDVRAWCSVSDRYEERDLLIEIMNCLPEQSDEFDMDTDHIRNKLHQELLGRKYLIVMDDMWDIQAYEDMQMSFPENHNGSRILFTSRHSKAIPKAAGTGEPHPLRGLSDTESWDLLEAKVFHGTNCPTDFVEIGKTIASGCKGLPIAVIAIGGLLERTEKTLGWWEEVAKDINTRIAEDPESRCMSILELSYKHLPDHLKPCFLYFGAFMGNKEILVQKLLRLWIAEGFIGNVDPDKSIEDVAERCLEDLICRNLVIVTKERSQGGFKVCQVHDLLRTLCVSKAEPDNFLTTINGYAERFRFSSSYRDFGIYSDYSPPSVIYRHHRLIIHSKRNHLAMLKPSGPLVRSLLFYPITDKYPTNHYDLSFISKNFKLLRVLNLEDINVGTSFPSGIELLKRLRYLALSGEIASVPSTLAELWDLETLFVKGKGEVLVPDAILSMESLMHLRVNDVAIFKPQERESRSSSNLPCNLVTFSSISLSCGKDAVNLMKRLINIKKLKCTFKKSQVHSAECEHTPVFRSLTKLEALKVSYYKAIPSTCEYNFGSSLRKLAISRCHLQREHICTIGALPKLEVLKLISVAFDDQTLDMSEDVFEALKYLKLENLDVSEWIADSDGLLVLERLVLRKCRKLKEVPSSFKDTTTLHTIELQWCSQSAVISVKEIKRVKDESGNEFKLYIDFVE